METNDNGAGKWLALGLGIIVLEWMDGETLSSAFHRGMENHWYRPALIGAVVITSAHLFNALPDTIDPYFWLGKTKGLTERLHHGDAREN